MKNLNFENINVLPILDIEKNVDPEKLIDALIDGKINTVEITLRNNEASLFLSVISTVFIFPSIKASISFSGSTFFSMSKIGKTFIFSKFKFFIFLFFNYLLFKIELCFLLHIIQCLIKEK